jgi:hypothetical protein
VPEHQQAWDEALAQEQLHQRELLAVLRDELGAFARECASALTALDALGVTVIGDVASVYRQASLAYDVGRRLPELLPDGAPSDDLLVDLYKHLGRDEPPPAALRHAAELARTGGRSDRELLRAAVELEGIPERLEAVVGPGLTTALSAIEPLAQWVPLFARLRRKEVTAEEALAQAGRDVNEILDALAAGGVAPAVAVADATGLAASLRDVIDHADAAADTVENGKLEQVLAESRRTLEADLGRLADVIHGAADAPSGWLDARRSDHTALVTEVEQKLEKVERTRRVLAALLPRLRLVSRALTAVVRFEAVEHRLDPDREAGVVAARSEVLIGLSGLWDEVVAVGTTQAPPGEKPARSRRGLVVAALVVLALAAGTALAIALTAGGSGKKKEPTTTAAASVPSSTTTTVSATTTTKVTLTKAAPSRPVVSPVSAVFDPVGRETTYTVSARATRQGTPVYSWRLTPPPGNPGCNKFAPLPGHPNQASWHHADTDGCTHIGIQHDGWVYATVTTDAWVCTQRFFGTLTRVGARDEQCHRR